MKAFCLVALCLVACAAPVEGGDYDDQAPASVVVDAGRPVRLPPRFERLAPEAIPCDGPDQCPGEYYCDRLTLRCEGQGLIRR